MDRVLCTTNGELVLTREERTGSMEDQKAVKYVTCMGLNSKKTCGRMHASVRQRGQDWEHIHCSACTQPGCMQQT
jgi:hypothetical protein